MAQRGSAVVRNNNENVSGSLPGPGKYLRHAPVLCANIRLPRIFLNRKTLELRAGFAAASATNGKFYKENEG